jgi:hypothetical protein
VRVKPVWVLGSTESIDIVSVESLVDVGSVESVEVGSIELVELVGDDPYSVETLSNP